MEISTPQGPRRGTEEPLPYGPGAHATAAAVCIPAALDPSGACPRRGGGAGSRVGARRRGGRGSRAMTSSCMHITVLFMAVINRNLYTISAYKFHPVVCRYGIQISVNKCGALPPNLKHKNHYSLEWQNTMLSNNKHNSIPTALPYSHGGNTNVITWVTIYFMQR